MKMIIAFRGNGTSEVSVNAAVYALWRAKKGEGRVLFFSVRRGEGNPENFFLRRNAALEKKSCKTGMETLRKLVVAGKADEKGVSGCMRQVTAGLDLLYGNYPEERRLAVEYREGLFQILDCLQNYYKLIICDAGRQEDWLGELVIKRAALVVHGTEQNMRHLRELLSRPPLLQGEPYRFYLFGRYDSESKYSLYNLRRRFGGLTCRNSAGIPHCTQVWDACMDGELAAEWERWERIAVSEEMRKYIGAVRRFDREISRRL